MKRAPTVGDALKAAGSVGPFFEVEPWRSGQGWRRLEEFLEDRVAMDGRVDAARTTLDTFPGVTGSRVPTRVVASTVFMGLAARLVAPPLATAVLSGVAPGWSMPDLWWRPVQSGPWPLAVSETTATTIVDLHSPGRVTQAADQLNETILVGVVAVLVAAVHAQFALSEKVLWGNVASALTGAMTTLCNVEPGKAQIAAELVDAMLRHGPLAGTGELFQPESSRSRWFFVRQSCCLYYWVPGGGTCGDCVLTPTEVRLRQWKASSASAG